MRIKEKCDASGLIARQLRLGVGRGGRAALEEAAELVDRDHAILVLVRGFEETALARLGGAQFAAGILVDESHRLLQAGRDGRRRAGAVFAVEGGAVGRGAFASQSGCAKAKYL